jgi:peptidyl-prolyl cis-trans isomerase C
MADGEDLSTAAGRLWARLSARSAAPLARQALREPLAHFLIAGLALFTAGHLYQQRTDRHRIVITAAHAAQLANDYALQFGAKPDADDQIVRRRVVQKMQFLMQDLSAPAEPTDAQLQTYYQAHAAHYAAPPRTTFSHIYFSADVGGDAAAKTRATAVLRTLSDQTTRAPDKGDAFPDLYDFAAYEPDQVDRLFGRTPFSDAVVTTPPGHWAGPFRSGYGWHLLYVDARQAAAQPPLGQVRDAVRADYLQAAQDAANQTAFDKLARDYTVVRRDRNPAP